MNEIVHDQIVIETQVAKVDLQLKKLQLKSWKLIFQMLMSIQGFFTGMYKSKFKWFKLTFLSVWLTFFLLFFHIIIR